MDRQGCFWDFEEDDPVHTLISWDLPGRMARKRRKNGLNDAYGGQKSWKSGKNLHYGGG